MRTVNDKGIALIKEFEKCVLTVYKDIRGLLTAGWGHRTDLPEGTPISQSQADTWFLEDINAFCFAVDHLVTCQYVNSNEFSAVVCLAYNIGVNNLRTSHLLGLLNAGKFQVAADEFPKWDHCNGEVVAGLLRRREAERELFLEADEASGT